jgi:hypothetical protein
MARRQTVVDKGRAGGERQRILRDVIVRPRQQPIAKLAQLLLAGDRANQHAVTAGTVHLFHHHLRQIGQHVA